MCSSSPEYIEESYQIIDKLLLASGYVEACNFIQSRSPKRSNSSRKVTGDCVPLSLPYLQRLPAVILCVTSIVMIHPSALHLLLVRSLETFFVVPDLTIK